VYRLKPEDEQQSSADNQVIMASQMLILRTLVASSTENADSGKRFSACRKFFKLC